MQSSGCNDIGVTRINSWDLMTAIRLTVPLPMQDKVELLCKGSRKRNCHAVGLIAKELIANAAKHALAGRVKGLSVRTGLRRECRRLRLDGR
jgi:hypothetical protein